MTTALKEHIEISGKSPVPFAENQPVCRIGGVPVGRFRIEVVRQVETANRKPHRVFRTYFEVTPDTRIGR